MIFLLAALLFALAWSHEFVELMRRPDDAFPGRNDRLVWAAALIVAAPLGLMAFWYYRRTYLPQAKPDTPGFGPARDLS